MEKETVELREGEATPPPLSRTHSELSPVKSLVRAQSQILKVVHLPSDVIKVVDTAKGLALIRGCTGWINGKLLSFGGSPMTLVGDRIVVRGLNAALVSRLFFRAIVMSLLYMGQPDFKKRTGLPRGERYFWRRTGNAVHQTPVLMDLFPGMWDLYIFCELIFSMFVARANAATTTASQDVGSNHEGSAQHAKIGRYFDVLMRSVSFGGVVILLCRDLNLFFACVSMFLGTQGDQNIKMGWTVIVGVIGMLIVVGLDCHVVYSATYVGVATARLYRWKMAAARALSARKRGAFEAAENGDEELPVVGLGPSPPLFAVRERHERRILAALLHPFNEVPGPFRVDDDDEKEDEARNEEATEKKASSLSFKSLVAESPKSMSELGSKSVKLGSDGVHASARALKRGSQTMRKGTSYAANLPELAIKRFKQSKKVWEGYSSLAEKRQARLRDAWIDNMRKRSYKASARLLLATTVSCFVGVTVVGALTYLTLHFVKPLSSKLDRLDDEKACIDTTLDVYDTCVVASGLESAREDEAMSDEYVLSLTQQCGRCVEAHTVGVEIACGTQTAAQAAAYAQVSESMSEAQEAETLGDVLQLGGMDAALATAAGAAYANQTWANASEAVLDLASFVSGTSFVQETADKKVDDVMKALEDGGASDALVEDAAIALRNATALALANPAIFLTDEASDLAAFLLYGGATNETANEAAAAFLNASLAGGHEPLQIGPDMLRADSTLRAAGLDDALVSAIVNSEMIEDLAGLSSMLVMGGASMEVLNAAVAAFKKATIDSLVEGQQVADRALEYAALGARLVAGNATKAVVQAALDAFAASFGLSTGTVFGKPLRSIPETCVATNTENSVNEILKRRRNSLDRSIESLRLFINNLFMPCGAAAAFISLAVMVHGVRRMQDRYQRCSEEFRAYGSVDGIDLLALESKRLHVDDALLERSIFQYMLGPAAPHVLRFMAVMVSTTLTTVLLIFLAVFLCLCTFRMPAIYITSDLINVIRGGAMSSGAVWLAMQFVNWMYINKYVSNKTFIVHLACFDVFDILFGVFNLMTCYFDGIARIIVIYVIAMFSTWRCDYTVLDAKYAWLDPGYSSFVSTVMTSERMNNPALVTASRLVLSACHGAYHRRSRPKQVPAFAEPAEHPVVAILEEARTLRDEGLAVPPDVERRVAASLAWRRLHVIWTTTVNPSIVPWSVMQCRKKHVTAKLWRAARGEDDAATQEAAAAGGDAALFKQKGGALPLHLACENRARGGARLPDMLIPFQKGTLSVAFRLFEQNDDGVVGEDDIILHYQSLGGLLLSPREVDAMIETVSVIDKKYLEPKFDDDMIEEVEDRGFDFCEFLSYATWRLASEEPDARILDYGSGVSEMKPQVYDAVFQSAFARFQSTDEAIIDDEVSDFYATDRLTWVEFRTHVDHLRLNRGLAALDYDDVRACYELLKCGRDGATLEQSAVDRAAEHTVEEDEEDGISFDDFAQFFSHTIFARRY